MLGWHISIYRQTNEGASPAAAESARGARVAVWQTGLDGLNWIHQLVKEGGVIELGGNGYPLRYTGKAEALIPQIAVGPPEARRVWAFGENDILTDKWEGKTVIDDSEVASCRHDEWLLIEAWDES